MSVARALDDFVEHYAKSTGYLHCEHDPQWPSVCELGVPYRYVDGVDHIRWQAVRRAQAEDFAGVERALALDVHPDIKAYFGRYWAAGMHAAAPDGPVQLMFLWNDDDVRRLTENLLGHALAQQQSKSPFSVFFATTSEDSEYFLTVRNDTGEVQLELPGRKPVRTVAPNLAGFLESLAPMPPVV